MKFTTATKALGTFPVILAALALNVAASTLYVDPYSTRVVPPYADWSTAARTIQDAVDASAVGDEIVVMNGVYQTGGRIVDGAMSNRVAVTKAVTVRSVNGSGVTIIKGYQAPGTTNGDSAVRCVWLADGATLLGFTLTNGATRMAGDLDMEQSGGGAYCASASATLSDCVLVGNSAQSNAGGAAFGRLQNCALISNTAGYGGGGAFSATLNDCALTGNSASVGGGVCSCYATNCTLTNNWAFWGSEHVGYGGGSCLGSLTKCTLVGNSAPAGGGGSCEGVLINCTLANNWAGSQGGGAFYGTLMNCAVINNSAFWTGGVFGATLNNCTLVGNYASEYGGMTDCTANNTVAYYNTASDFSNWGGGSCNFCCTTPLPPNGVGNFTKAPLFMDQTGGNLRLQGGSPCINAGNNAYAPGGTDLDGRARIVGDTVDTGAYESQGAGMSEFIGWLEQYRLPADGTADTVDSDRDGMNNWQEWRAGTDPTNAVSVLQMLAPSNDPSGIAVTWQSVTNRTYYLQGSADLAAQPAFLTLQTNIIGHAGTTSFTDTNAVGSSPFFYRVGVQ
jgi:hypothetical protein